jgi:DNA transposition AAA+ family ATPase
VRKRVLDYLSRNGLSWQEFARRIGYSDAAVRFFLCDTYHYIAGSARVLAGKAAVFMDQHPVEPPTHVTGELYSTANVRTIQETFEQLLPRPTAFMIYAPPGSQKSFVLEHQVAALNLAEMTTKGTRRAFYIYARQGLRPRDLIRRVAIACGCRVSNAIDVMLDGIRFEFRASRVVLVIDEANHLSLECLETLRELLDRPPHFSLLFAGSHDLKRKFDEFSATLEQWNSRIIAKVRLPGLERREARGIVEREIGQLLRDRPRQEAEQLVDELIANSTTRDAFDGGRTYVNVRTLTNALDQIKAATLPPETEASEEAR